MTTMTNRLDTLNLQNATMNGLVNQHHLIIIMSTNALNATKCGNTTHLDKLMSEQQERLDQWEQKQIGFAMGYLVDALTEEKKYVSSKLGQAINQLNEVIGNLNPTEELTEDEAELSSSLHTWLRKYDDSHLGSILYAYIKEDRARRVWVAFIKYLIKKHDSKIFNINILDTLNLSTTDERIMTRLLYMWHDSESLKSAIKDMIEWESLKPNEKPKKDKSVV
jgi:hypothetical protein